MSLALNVRNWRELSGNNLWAMNLRRLNFFAQGHKCDRCGENQAKLFSQKAPFSIFNCALNMPLRMDVNNNYIIAYKTFVLTRSPPSINPTWTS